MITKLLKNQTMWIILLIILGLYISSPYMTPQLLVNFGTVETDQCYVTGAYAAQPTNFESNSPTLNIVYWYVYAYDGDRFGITENDEIESWAGGIYNVRYYGVCTSSTSKRDACEQGYAEANSRSILESSTYPSKCADHFGTANLGANPDYTEAAGGGSPLNPELEGVDIELEKEKAKNNGEGFFTTIANSIQQFINWIGGLFR